MIRGVNIWLASAYLFFPMIFLVGLVAPALGDDPKSAPVPIVKRGESIVVAGRKIAIGTPVILWTEPGGYDAYAPKPPSSTETKEEKKATSPGFGQRRHGLNEAQLAEIKDNGWTLPLLRESVDQFVIHYDVCGTSQKCFEVLRRRNLSVHFMLDLDGTLYQTLDLKEAAYHATKANGRSVGIEIANMGAYPTQDLAKSPLPRWYERDAQGKTQIRLPASAVIPTRPTGSEPLHPSRDEPVVGTVQGQELIMYDLTPEQYAALAKLTDGLCSTFPKIHRDLPRDGGGKVVDHVLDDDVYKHYQGILGHFHVQLNKTDPGPAFQWDRVLGGLKTSTAAK